MTIPKGVNPEQVTCTLAPGGVLQICAPKQTTEGISAHVFIPNRLFPIESILKMICFVVYRLQRVGSSDYHSTRRSIGRSLRRSQSRAQQVKIEEIEKSVQEINTRLRCEKCESKEK